MKIIAGLTLLMAVFVSAPPAAAKATESDCASGELCAQNPKMLVKALHAMGYAAKLDSSKELGRYLVTEVAGGPVAIKFFDCESKNNCATLSLNKWYRKDSYHSLERVNLWNRTRNFGRAYIKDDIVAFDYYLRDIDKMNADQLRAALEWWGGEAEKFTDFICTCHGGNEEKDETAVKKSGA